MLHNYINYVLYIKTDLYSYVYRSVMNRKK